MKKKTKLIIYVVTLISVALWLVISFVTGQWHEIWGVTKDIFILQLKSIWLAFPVYVTGGLASIAYMSEDKP